ncbi:hypothetical protein D3C73_1395420 [compost metagenome]
MIRQPLVPFRSDRERTLDNSDGGVIVYGQMLSDNPPDHACSASQDIHTVSPKQIGLDDLWFQLDRLIDGHPSLEPPVRNLPVTIFSAQLL